MLDAITTEDFERRVEAVVARAERAAHLAMLGAKEEDAPVPVPSLPPAASGTPGRALADALGLSDDELELVWSVVARAVDPRVSGHARVVFGSEARLGASLGQHIAWHELTAPTCRDLLDVLDPRHVLQTSGLITPMGPTPYDVCTPWAAAPRLISFLRGSEALDPSLDHVGELIEVPAGGRHSAEQFEAMDTLHGWLTAVAQATVLIEGPTGTGRRTAAALAAAPRPVLAVDFARVAPRRAAEVIAAMRREVLLRGALPLLANLDELWARLPPGEETALALLAAVEHLGDLVVVTTSTPTLELGASRRALLRVRWPVPDAVTRHALWSDALGEVDPAAELDMVAHRYALGAGGIAAATRSAHHHATRHGRAQPIFADLVDGLQDNITERLGELARRVAVKQEWSELVLPPETLEDVTALVSRIRHAHFVLDHWNFRRKLARGAGVAALFSGPPGTGKTMVAGLIARELSLELYQVDLSRIVSKWVGETEKQLAKVFEAAEAGHALLLFDEADALFAKRSAEVKSAVDRYANLEVNYLLQRVESFGGVVILTTNLDASIDPALRRRLASHIVFGTPELEERTRLWREMLAVGAPLEGELDLEELAEEFPAMTGANIRNAVLTAAFVAAEQGAAIGLAHLRAGARGEYRAMGHVLSRDDRAAGRGSGGARR